MAPLRTSFQSPTRMAPPRGVVLSRISSCGEGLPWVSAGQDVAAIERQLLVQRSAGQLEQRRIPIHHVQRLRDGGARLDVALPGDAGADARAALVDGALAGAQRAVAGDAAGTGAAVVAGEEDQRVGAEAARIERRQNPADRLVHRGDHARRRCGAARAGWRRARSISRAPGAARARR